MGGRRLVLLFCVTIAIPLLSSILRWIICLEVGVETRFIR